MFPSVYILCFRARGKISTADFTSKFFTKGQSRVQSSRGSQEDVIQTEGVTEVAGSLGLRDLGVVGLPHGLLCSAGVKGEDGR